jgi:DegV family protein with EDD domain
MRNFNLPKAREMLRMGDLMLRSYKKLLDVTNVWPMPDGDTGKNLCKTSGSIAERVNALPETADFDAFADALSAGAIIGSKGNSGTIFAAWIMGVCDYLRADTARFRPETFAKALRHGYTEAYTKIGDPKSGSMLTVMADIATGLESMVAIGVDGTFLNVIVEIAKSSVDSTENLLPILKAHSVVDSGAAGVMLFLEGIYKSHIGDSSTKSSYARFDDFTPNLEVEKHHHNVKTKFRYCTQAVFQTNEPLDMEKERQFLSKSGDSEVLVNFRNIYKLHVHTNRPQSVLKHFAKYGELQTDIEDMKAQSAARTKSLLLANAKIYDETVAIITDATADISATDAENSRITVIGMNMKVGETRFLHQPDWPNLSPTEFYSLLSKSGASSFSTEAVSEYEWLEAAKPYLENGKDVIFLPMAETLSSTFQHAALATQELNKMFPHRNIACVNSRTTSCGLAFIAVKTRAALSTGATFQEAVDYAEKLTRCVHVYFVIDNIDFLLHGGRMTEKQFKSAKQFGRRPMINIDKDGRLERVMYIKNPKNLLSQALSRNVYRGTVKRDEAFTALSEMAMGALHNHSLGDSIISIIHTGQPEVAEDLVASLHQRYLMNKLEVPITPIGPVVGGHVGSGRGVGLFLFGKEK